MAPAETTITPDEVMSGALLGATDTTTTSIKGSEILALNDDMREFLRLNVNPGATDQVKMQQ